MLTRFYELTDDYKDIQVVSNFHTHNYLCGHAGGTVCDFAEVAVKNGLTALGISDHCTSPLGGEGYMTLNDLGMEYLPQFEIARKKYKNLRIYSGVEIIYFEGHDNEYARGLNKLDYLVLGQHEYMMNGKRCNSFTDGVDEKNVVAYFENAAAGLKTGLFSVFAHPDLIFYRGTKITPKIADAFERAVGAAVEHGVAVELNANGIRNHGFRYPTDLLIELCKAHGARVVVSSDSHSPKEFVDESMLRLLAYAYKTGLNVVNEIKITPR